MPRSCALWKLAHQEVTEFDLDESILTSRTSPLSPNLMHRRQRDDVGMSEPLSEQLLIDDIVGRPTHESYWRFRIIVVERTGMLVFPRHGIMWCRQIAARTSGPTPHQKPQQNRGHGPRPEDFEHGAA